MMEPMTESELDRALLATGHLDELRATEFRRLDEGGHVYLDHTGSALYPVSLVQSHLEHLRDGVFGNPHSDNPASRPMTERVASARTAVLRFTGADPDEFECIFTPNATGAIRLVGESFPFGRDRPLVLSADNHNSVNGVREPARRAGTTTTYLPLTTELRLDRDAMAMALCGPPGLLALPAQSNYSGVQHPLPEVPEGWRVLYDVAAYAPTNELRLDGMAVDYVSLSFYKMFGYPTGIGALIARRDALEELNRPWFAGGTIAIASVSADGHRLVPGHAGFEDGTVDFLAMAAVEAGIDLLERLDVRSIHDRVGVLTGWLLERMASLRHRSGAPLVRVLGPVEGTGRGGTIAFVLLDPHGMELPDRRVEQLATAAGISLRTGCFCNPGAGEAARGLVAEDLRPFIEDATEVSLCEVDAAMRARRGAGVSALRISFGMSSNAADVRTFASWLEGFLDRSVQDVGPAPPAPPIGPDTA